MVEPIPTLWLEVTAKIEIPEEEATLNKVLVVPAVPWMLKEIVDEVAPIPATVPLSIKMPEAVVVGPVYLTTKPAVPEPPSLLLKVVQSVFWS